MRADTAYNKAMAMDPMALRQMVKNNALGSCTQVMPPAKSVNKHPKADDSAYYEALGLNEYG